MKTNAKISACSSVDAQTESRPVRGASGALIWQTIVDLSNANRQATRQVLVEQTGLTYGIVDDHVKRMIEEGRLRRVLPGVFEPTNDHVEDRAVSMTHLPGGMCKLEIGDSCVEMTLREARMVAMAVSGVALQFGR